MSSGILVYCVHTMSAATMPLNAREHTVITFMKYDQYYLRIFRVDARICFFICFSVKSSAKVYYTKNLPRHV